MNKIVIYSPVNGEISKIEEISDDLFSNKVLGDGFFIKPDKKIKDVVLKSLFDKSEVELILDSNHAIYFKLENDISCLMHIGLDSGFYKKDTFQSFVKKGDMLSNKDNLIKYSSDFFKKNKLKDDIPIVFETERFKNFELTITKTGKVKEGEEIAFIVERNVKNQHISKPENKKNFNKWKETAVQLIDIVGESNFEKVWNCMTRTRFYVIDKEKVNESKIQNVPNVKGYVWSGNELQVVIGGNSVKVKEEIEKLWGRNNFEIKSIEEDKKSKSFGSKIMSAINGIIVPLMPLLISVGLIAGLSSVLTNFGVIQGGPPEGGYITDMDIISGIFYMLSNTGLALLSIFFCYSTVRYLNGDPAMAILVGLTIASRYFVNMIDGSLGSGEWVLFKIGDFPISVKAYNNNLLPAVGAGFMFYFTDKWIKTWMPGVVDIIFRPFISYIITIFATFFVLGPILGIVEVGISELAILFYEVPFGIGGLLFGIVWQPIVFLGMGWPVYLAMDANYFTGNGPLIGLPIMDGIALAMIGVILVIMIKAKKRNDKINAAGTLMPLIFGITEPAMYGVTAPKVKPFWITCIGGGIVGMLMSLFHVQRESMGGGGVLGILGHQHWEDLVLYLAISMLGLIINFVCMWVLYDEKDKDYKSVQKANRKLYLYLKSRKTNINKKDLEIFKNLEEVQKNQELEKKIFKNWSLTQKLNYKIEALNDKTKKDIKSEENIKLFEQKILILKSELVDLTSNYEKICQKIYDETEKELVKFSNILKDDLNEFKKIYFNSINNTLIYIEIKNKESVNLNKNKIFNTDNKFKLLLSY
ncbi:hypothetical protein CK556_01590 [Mesoplasma chauliocola]|uniref:Uncharacterized protein n=1 Tax=Mesoplasma chauliocola TaxID=216427 RepID=A0A249SN35_9MOLU|nr:PTS glucose transporter subunit IIA [Mesoplasma chauliocola]ASZ09048.1 hypothetical protein CK556_01590 [Mesoplasma chauliocola]